MKQSLSTPLSDAELELLDNFLLNRINDEQPNSDSDEGIYEISALDGYLTAIVSGPSMIPPSVWLPAMWGDFEPEWESEAAFGTIFSLIVRHMNEIAELLMEQPENFNPIFYQSKVDDNETLVVDEWCQGYMRGVALDPGRWDNGDQQLGIMLTPIMVFASEAGWDTLENYSPEEISNVQQAIPQVAREIYGYWLSRRNDISTAQPIRRDAPKVGRNDPCYCGSGKKYKHCCGAN